MSVISMLASPNDESPANIDAAVSLIYISINIYILVTTWFFVVIIYNNNNNNNNNNNDNK